MAESSYLVRSSAVAVLGVKIVQEPMFKIRYDPERRLVRVERWGLWGAEQAERYRTELAAAVAEAKSRVGPFDVLIDIGRAETMPQPATLIMAEVAADLEAGPARRVAFAGPGALKRLQVRRLVGDPSRFGMFDTMGDALHWLAEPR